MVRTDDKELISRIKADNDEESLKELVRKHEALCYKVANHYFEVASNLGIYFNDLLDNKYLLVFNAAKKWDENRGVKFSTLLQNEARFYCLKKISKQKSTVNIEDYDWDNIIDETEDHSKLEIESISIIFNQLTDSKAKKILRLKFFSGKNASIRSISRQIGMSPQATLMIYNRILAFLRKKIEYSNDFA